ncbi:MAG: RNase adapter RapZ [Alphaproteobacteria bacterium]|nr:MAG: RNase adapter RapZ [Alphaproteobacteria bacterium]
MTSPEQDKESYRKVVILTGMSGAGITTGMRALEDLGFEAVSGLRLDLIEPLIENGAADGKPLAISLEARVPGFSADRVVDLMKRLRERRDIGLHAVFLDCQDPVLMRRYTESRRRHPMTADGVPVAEGIVRERDLLEPVREAVSRTINTSTMSCHDLRGSLHGIYGHPGVPGLHVHVMSFSYRQGLPGSADIVRDVRSLRNPFWDPELKKLTGQDSRVADYVKEDALYPPLFGNMTSILTLELERFDRDGRGDLTVAFGCTGGQHRSVFLAEELARWLRQNTQYPVSLRHRELDRAN